MRAYLLDEGVLLTEKDEEFESYNTVYDKNMGIMMKDNVILQRKTKLLNRLNSM